MAMQSGGEAARSEGAPHIGIIPGGEGDPPQAPDIRACFFFDAQMKHIDPLVAEGLKSGIAGGRC